MKEKKRRIECFAFYDHTGIEAHLEKMARRGWMLESIGNLGWVYRRTDTQRMKCKVTYYPKASVFDPEPPQEQKILHEYCAHTGWQLACVSAQMQVFYSGLENPVPIETDPVLEVENIHKSAKKQILLPYSVWAGMALWQIGRVLSLVWRGQAGLMELLSNNLFLFLCVVALLLLMECAAQIGGYFLWYFHAKRTARQGVFPRAAGAVWRRVWHVAFLLASVSLLIGTAAMQTGPGRFIFYIMAVYFTALLVFAYSFHEWLKRTKAPRNMNLTATFLSTLVAAFLLGNVVEFTVNRGLAFGWFEQEADGAEGHLCVVCQEEVPLKEEELWGEHFESGVYRRRGSESLLLGHLAVDLYPWEEEPRLHYTVTIVKTPFLYDWCRKYLMREVDESADRRIPEGRKKVYLEQDASPWGAREAYRLTAQDTGPLNWYLLCYEDRIVVIRAGQEFTPGQMAYVGGKLGF